MIVLVDFENTHQSGFDGYEYLNEQDTLVVYYSDENSALSKGMVDDLKKRNVNVRMVKLLKQHANALDMYIASTTGMYLESGEKICIVSKDKGYAAVRDFWHSLRGAEILLGETIEECFLHSVQNDDERIRSAKERYQKVQLTQAFETMNKVPTRPTLSRSHRRRNNFDTNRNLEPVEILPDPLKKEDTARKDSSSQEGQKQELTAENAVASVSAAAAEKVREEEKPKQPAEVSKEKKPALKEKEVRNEAAAQREEKTEEKSVPEAKKNVVSYRYDPVSRTMVQVGGEADAEQAEAPVSQEKQETTDAPVTAEIAPTEENAAEDDVQVTAPKKRRRRRKKASSDAGKTSVAEETTAAESDSVITQIEKITEAAAEATATTVFEEGQSPIELYLQEMETKQAEKAKSEEQQTVSDKAEEHSEQTSGEKKKPTRRGRRKSQKSKELTAEVQETASAAEAESAAAEKAATTDSPETGEPEAAEKEKKPKAGKTAKKAKEKNEAAEDVKAEKKPAAKRGRKAKPKTDMQETEPKAIETVKTAEAETKTVEAEKEGEEKPKAKTTRRRGRKPAAKKDES